MMVALRRQPARFRLRGRGPGRGAPPVEYQATVAGFGVEIEYRVEAGERGLDIYRPLDGRRLALSWRQLVSLALAYGCGSERRPR